ATALLLNVPASEITTDEGELNNNARDSRLGYGEVASLAATLPVPEEVPLKELRDFKIIGTDRKNVDGKKIVTGKPMFGMDYDPEGALVAMIVHPPAFGLKVKSVDEASVKSMPGIKDVVVIKVLEDGYERNSFDVTSFTEFVAIVGNTTWEVM